jgi:hypothetical protein
MKDEILVKLLVVAADVRDRCQRIADDAQLAYEEVVTMAIEVHGDPSVIAATEEERNTGAHQFGTDAAYQQIYGKERDE